MKVTTQTNAKVDFQLSIGLEPPTKHVDTDEKVKPKSFTCKMHPNKKDSAEFLVKIYAFSDGSPEEYIETLKQLTVVQTGQNVKRNEDIVVLYKQIFEGALLEAFENEISDEDPITDDVLNRGRNAMTKIVFPDKAVRHQKKAMKKIKKPMKMKFREFANRMKKINEMLTFFPLLPDGSKPKPMPNDEFLELLHDALPKSGYQNVMQQHDYDPTQDTFHNFITWVERRCEPFDDREPRNKQDGNLDKPIPKKKHTNKRKNDGNNQPNKGGEPAAKKGRKFCIHHKWCDHVTDDCKVVKAMYEKHAPPKNNYQHKKAHDMHMIDQASKNTKDYLESEECFAILKKHVAKINNPLFKAMKSEMREEFFMINDNDDGRKLSDKELKQMQTGLTLNKDTSNNDMDEDTSDDDY